MSITHGRHVVTSTVKKHWKKGHRAGYHISRPTHSDSLPPVGIHSLKVKRSLSTVATNKDLWVTVHIQNTACFLPIFSCCLYFASSIFNCLYSYFIIFFEDFFTLFTSSLLVFLFVQNLLIGYIHTYLSLLCCFSFGQNMKIDHPNKCAVVFF